MKYIILQTLFGWLTRPILLWNLLDFAMAGCEIYLIYFAINSLKIKKRKNRRFLKEYKKLGRSCKNER
jgi:hypothetical protein